MLCSEHSFFGYFPLQLCAFIKRWNKVWAVSFNALLAGRTVQEVEYDAWSRPFLIKDLLEAIEVEDMLAVELDARLASKS